MVPVQQTKAPGSKVGHVTQVTEVIGHVTGILYFSHSHHKWVRNDYIKICLVFSVKFITFKYIVLNMLWYAKN